LRSLESGRGSIAGGRVASALKRGTRLADIFQHIGLVLFYVLLFILNLLIFLGIPGSWIALAAILIYDIASGFSTVGWVLLVMVAVAILGELVESFLGLVYVAQKGATKWGVIGAFVGGFGGVIAGSLVIPFIGSVLFGLAGAFTGAVICEYLYYESMDKALKTGFFAFIGKLGAMLVKYALGLVMIGIFIYMSWR